MSCGLHALRQAVRLPWRSYVRGLADQNDTLAVHSDDNAIYGWERRFLLRNSLHLRLCSGAHTLVRRRHIHGTTPHRHHRRPPRVQLEGAERRPDLRQAQRQLQRQGLGRWPSKPNNDPAAALSQRARSETHESTAASPTPPNHILWGSYLEHLSLALSF